MRDRFVEPKRRTEEEIKNNQDYKKNKVFAHTSIHEKAKISNKGAEYHATAKINRGEFALESKEIKEMSLQTVKTTL